MDTWYARPVLFVRDVANSVAFYVERIGFKQDWAHRENGRIIVAQVSRGDFELILNQDSPRAGSGRIYFHLTQQQIEGLRREVEAQSLPVHDRHWGMPISEICDPDGNELFFDALAPRSPAAE
jgi:catechol 2,3-dioxygenase-like lactoylglutathione lyase family enzyme